jgi:hypothetical protein
MYEIKNEIGSALDYENALFVLKSMSDDESRPFMCVVHVEEAEEGAAWCVRMEDVYITRTFP